MNFFPSPLASQLIRLARYQMMRSFGRSEPSQRPWVATTSDFPFDKVNITLRRQGSLLASWGGQGETLSEAVCNAVKKAVVDKRFGGHIVAAELETTTIELLIQTKRVLIQEHNLEKIKRRIKLGVDGVELRVHGKRAYFKPTVAITHSIRTHKVLLNRLAKKTGLEPEVWRAPEAKVYRTEWLHFVEHEGEAVELYRMRRRWNRPISEKSIYQANALALQHLIGIQRADGAYTYIIEPLKDTTDNSGFSMVRMAGSTYAVSRAAAFETDPSRKKLGLQSARRAIDYLLRRKSSLRETGEASFIAERRRGKKRAYGKLGASALTLLALQYGPFIEDYAVEREELVKAILSMQTSTGKFNTHMYSPDWTSADKEERERSQDFYPGEALLALSHELRRSKNPEIRQRIEDAFPYYRDRFGDAPATAFILWQGDAWTVMAEEELSNGNKTRGEEYADFVFQQIEWVMPLIYRQSNTPHDDWVGGLTRPKVPRGTTTSCIMEAIIRACGLAALIGDQERSARYRRAALDGINFQLRTQIEECESFYFKRPELAIGGMTETLSRLIIRNDYDQHVLTAWVAAQQTAALRLNDA